MTEFKENGYVLVRNITAVDKWYKIAKSLEYIGQGDPVVGGSPALYNRAELLELYDLLQKILEPMLGLTLYKTYSFLRIYKNDARLPPHRDRAACEVSVTLNLGGDDWKIGIFDYENNPHEYVLSPGDCIIYKGCDLVHWRPSAFRGGELVQVFLHFVDSNGENSWAKNDFFKRRPPFFIRWLLHHI